VSKVPLRIECVAGFDVVLGWHVPVGASRHVPGVFAHCVNRLGFGEEDDMLSALYCCESWLRVVIDRWRLSMFLT